MGEKKPPAQPRRGLLSGGYAEQAEQPEAAQEARPAPARKSNARPRTPPKSGGLLSRYAAESAPLAPTDDESGSDEPVIEKPPAAQAGSLRGWRQLAGGARRLGENLRHHTASPADAEQAAKSAQQPVKQPPAAPPEQARQPGAGDWRATDFNTTEIEQWDRHGAMPFEAPPDPDAYQPTTAPRVAHPRQDGDRGRHPRSGGGRSARQGWDEDERDEAVGRERGYDAEREYDVERGYTGEHDYPPEQGYTAEHDYPSERDYTAERRYPPEREFAPERDYTAEHDYPAERDYTGERAYAAEAGPDTGNWETSWATSEDLAIAPPPRRRRMTAAELTLVGGLRQALDHDLLIDSLDTMAHLTTVAHEMSRMERVRLLMRRRPTAAAMLAFFLLGVILTCIAPLIPLSRISSVTSDLQRHVTHLQQLAAGGSALLLDGAGLREAQVDIAAINSDLYELNGVATIVGTPIGALSPTVRDERLLIHLGFDLTSAANETIQVAQTLLTPLDGAALSSSAAAPSVNQADIQRASALLDDATARALDATAVYQQLDQSALPAQLQPGTPDGKLLALTPHVAQGFAELKSLVDAAPALLGVGQPAYYLTIAMDSSELRAGGGYQGNYGVLELDNGKQSRSRPLTMQATQTTLDALYAQKFGDPAGANGCSSQVTEPPASAWWWPQRCVKQFGWGLRDANLSPDFPTNAQTALQIAQSVGATPAGAKMQGVVAFTPALIANILQVTGPVSLPDYNVTVSADTLEQTIHTLQAPGGAPAGQDPTKFTGALTTQLLARMSTLHGADLKAIYTITAQAIASKDLQVYFTDPRAELVLRQIGLASAARTGGGDGYFVVDTNDGGNKANLYVTETQTDYVTLLPDGSASHQLLITVTYDKHGRNVFDSGSNFVDYSDMQRTYLPSDATSIGWSGFVPASLTPTGCPGGNYATVISDCSQAHGIFGVTTTSDLSGRAMVMGPLLVLCGSAVQGDWGSYSPSQEPSECALPQAPHTQNIFIAWTTPHAYTPDPSGHGVYTEQVEKQSGDQPRLQVYVTRAATASTQVISDLGKLTQLTANANKVFDGMLTKNEVISYSY